MERQASAATAAAHAMTRSRRGAKGQVAQFGTDSNEAPAIGLKKKSEYKTRTRKTPTK